MRVAPILRPAHSTDRTLADATRQISWGSEPREDGCVKVYGLPGPDRTAGFVSWSSLAAEGRTRSAGYTWPQHLRLQLNGVVRTYQNPKKPSSRSLDQFGPRKANFGELFRTSTNRKEPYFQ